MTPLKAAFLCFVSSAFVAAFKVLYKESIETVNRPVTPKSVPPKIGPAGPILAEKLVPRTIFAAKIGPAGLILAAKIGPPLPKSVPPQK